MMAKADLKEIFLNNMGREVFLQHGCYYPSQSTDQSMRKKGQSQRAASMLTNFSAAATSLSSLSKANQKNLAVPKGRVGSSNVRVHPLTQHRESEGQSFNPPIILKSETEAPSAPMKERGIIRRQNSVTQAVDA